MLRCGSNTNLYPVERQWLDQNPACSPLATAQTYPSRPITMIVPYAPGGTTDAIARGLAERMKSSLGQSIIIENVSGANGSIGTGRAVHARPDGYMIELGGQSTHVLNGVLYSLPYDMLQDFGRRDPALGWTKWFAFAARHRVR